MLYALIKPVVLLAIAAAAHYAGVLPYAVASIVALHVFVAARRLGFSASMVSHAIPASIAVLGVAALSTQRLDFLPAVVLALACAALYGVLRPKAPKVRLGHGIGVLRSLSKLA